MTRYFPERQKVRNPEVVLPTINDRGDEGWKTESIPGKFYRVMPSTPREVFAIQMLEHRLDKFAPATGHGVIVTEEALLKFD